ncbi:ThiF family adenylyltransferase [Tenacibaculum jejuense]|uniref:UBA/THIF-type NAD/FAD binding protein n=1 Tax=Tenacibaculum jejuense TaxID=584609 RepID=A0A238UE85_9FLAO|nr:ThiF family adenylyltransferase [Tenacibaculum jejuense]SNR17316.1 UBA/THIF-type NAD/FAD binding protein [Tenacibaculum jejuense]
MNERYIRNRLYLNDQEQEMIKNCSIILGGSGIGSTIAECALRLGFEKITIIDGDQVELSNLNRQNYTEDDINIDKVEAIKNRLLSINSNAEINVFNEFITEDNIKGCIEGHEIAINALDFSSEIPLLFDEICQENKIPVLHPYNLGWGGLVTVINPKGLSLKTLKRNNEEFNEVNVVKYATSYLKFWGNPHDWIEEILDKYVNEKEILPPPQLSIASWFVAAICTHLLYNIATKKEYKEFPEFYLSTIMNN